MFDPNNDPLSAAGMESIFDLIGERLPLEERLCQYRDNYGDCGQPALPYSIYCAGHGE